MFVCIYLTGFDNVCMCPCVCMDVRVYASNNVKLHVNLIFLV